MNIKISTLLLAFASFAFAQGTPQEKVDVGYAGPDFELPGADGKTYKLSDYTDKIVVLEWTNHDCPFVKKCYGGHIQDIQNEFTGKGVVWFVIDSGKDANPQGGNINLRLTKAKPTAYLLDPSGKVGRSFQAKSSPHMFVMKKDNIIAYHGALDSAATPKIEDINGPGVRHHVVEVLDRLLKGKDPFTKPTAPYGCPIKYAPVEPAVPAAPAAPTP